MLIKGMLECGVQETSTLRAIRRKGAYISLYYRIPVSTVAFLVNGDYTHQIRSQ